MRLLAASDDRVICPEVSVARSFYGRLVGLMGRRALEEGEGLYLPGTKSIHMLFMRFPIDCLFLGKADDDGLMQVVSVRRSLPVWTGVVWYVRGARGVVEMSAGAIDAAGVRAGDLVRFEEAARPTR